MARAQGSKVLTAADWWETLRERYRPAPVRVLLVGESPPAGGTFFYAANSRLFEYTRAAFRRAFDRCPCGDETFLRWFQAEGFYLDDLCLTPVNNLDRANRRQGWRAGIPRLASRITELKPEYVICVMEGIRPSVEAALRMSGVTAELHSLPFPAFGNQKKYVEGLTSILENLRSRGVVAGV